MGRPQLVVMGRAAGAFGLKGELRVHSYAQDPEVFIRAGWFHAGSDPQTAQAYQVLSFRPHGGRVLFSTSEIKTREQAEALKGAWIYLPAESLPLPEEDEYYWYQLMGVRVFNPQGRELGSIEKVYDSGAHELWDILSPDGHEAVLPILEGVIQDMDLDTGRVIVEPPPGLLSAQGWPPEYDLEADEL